MKLAMAVIATAAVAGGLFGAETKILPEEFGRFKVKERTAAPAPANAELAAEYGLEASESAEYSGPQKVSITAWRLKDSTGAFGFLAWRSAEAGTWLQSGNYVLKFAGTRLRKDSLAALTAKLPNLRRQPLPALPGYLPKEGLDAKSQRYILGAASLRQFEPRIPADIARFDLGSEAQIARYKQGDADVSLAVFSYPTPQMARIRVKEFEKFGGVAARSGPLVSVAFGPPEAAEKLVKSVRYEASITWNEATKDYSGNPGDMLIAIFQMIGFILVFCAAAGIVFALIRGVHRGGFGKENANDAMITLHIDQP